MARTKRTDETVKVDAEVLRKARYVILERDVTLAAYVSEILRPVVDRDYAATVARLAKQPKK